MEVADRAARILMLDDSFWRIGSELAKHSPDNRNNIGMQRFRSVFGTSPRVCATIWHELSPYLGRDANMIHLLYALFFLRHYLIEMVNRIIFNGVDEKTLRKYCHMYVNLMATRLTHMVLKIISIFCFLFLDYLWCVVNLIN